MARIVLFFTLFLVLFGSRSLWAEAPREVADSVGTPSEQDKAPALGWHHESSLGITLNGGNSDSQSYLVRQATSYTWTSDVVRSFGHYMYGDSNSGVNANNWDIGGRYEHYFTDSLGGLIGYSWEGDTFAGIDYRMNADLGFRYYLIGRNPRADYLVNETGYRFQYEVRVPGQPLRYLDNEYLRIYFDGKKTLTDSVYFRLWVEFLPNFSITQHYLFNFEPSLGVMLTKVLSLKVAFDGSYNGMPAVGKKNFDYIYTTSLVASF